MIRNWPGIRVDDVKASSRWYRSLLDCKSMKDGPHRELFDQLADADGTVVLSLVSWKGHDDPWDADGATGKGLSLYFVVDDFDGAWKRAQALRATVDQEPHRETTGFATREFSLRDPDGYRLSVGDAKLGWLANPTFM